MVFDSEQQKTAFFQIIQTYDFRGADAEALTVLHQQVREAEVFADEEDRDDE